MYVEITLLKRKCTQETIYVLICKTLKIYPLTNTEYTLIINTIVDNRECYLLFKISISAVIFWLLFITQSYGNYFFYRFPQYN